MDEYEPFTPEEIAEVHRYFALLDVSYRPRIEFGTDETTVLIDGGNLRLGKYQRGIRGDKYYRAFDEVICEAQRTTDIGIAARWLVERYVKLAFMRTDWDTPTKRGEDE